MSMDWHTVAWALWALAFCAVEGEALFNKRAGDTLSEHVWALFRTKPGQPVTGNVRLRRTILLGFMAWLTIHFVLGGTVV